MKEYNFDKDVSVKLFAIHKDVIEKWIAINLINEKKAISNLKFYRYNDKLF